MTRSAFVVKTNSQSIMDAPFTRPNSTHQKYLTYNVGLVLVCNATAVRFRTVLSDELWFKIIAMLQIQKRLRHGFRDLKKRFAEIDFLLVVYKIVNTSLFKVNSKLCSTLKPLCSWNHCVHAHIALTNDKQDFEHSNCSNRIWSWNANHRQVLAVLDCPRDRVRCWWDSDRDLSVWNCFTPIQKSTLLQSIRMNFLFQNDKIKKMKQVLSKFDVYIHYHKCIDKHALS